MGKGVNSIQNLIEDFLRNNKSNIVLNQKKGYRTFSINGGDLSDKINKTKTLLYNKNIRKGDKIIIIGNNSIEYVVLYLSCILSGIVVVPLDMMTDKKLFTKIKNQLKPKAVFHDKNISISTQIKKFYLENLDNLIENVSQKNINVKIFPKDILQIIYTSGTTSDPKGVVLTNENITSGLNSAVDLIPLKIKLKFLNLLPLSHIFSQVYGLFFPMYFSYEIFFIDTIRPRKIISYIKNKKINGAILVPGILQSLKNRLEGKLISKELGIQFRLIGVGGTYLDVELEKFWKRHLILLIQGYGLTETSSVISGNPIISKTGSVGKISKNVEFKLEEDEEILVKGKNIFSGYYKNKEKTEESFENGWFKTGDVGEIKNNYLYLKERKKDIIITSSGLNVYPVDIELTLNKIPEIKESCVLQKENKVHAVLILNQKTNPENLIRKANHSLLSQQKIQSFSIWSEKDFPKTILGKIKKYQMLEKLTSQQKSESYSYKDKLFNIVDKILHSSKKITSKSKLSDIGMDSLKRVELISELEIAFETEINEAIVNQYTTVDDLQKIIKKPAFHMKFPKWIMNPLIKFIRIIFQKIFFNPLMYFSTRTEYLGKENLEDISKPVIFASNHQSALDIPVINKILAKNGFRTVVPADSYYVFGIGKKGNIFNKIYMKLRGFCSALFYNSYPFGETIGTDRSLEFTGEFLDRNYSIIIFPEAERTRTGNMNPFKPGIGFLALNMKVPIIPIKVEGLYEIMPAETLFPKLGKSKVKIGKPILAKEFEKLSYISATKLIEKRIRGL